MAITQAANFFIKRGDTLPAIPATLTDAAGNAVDLSGAAVNFTMRLANKYPTAYKVNAAAQVTSPATNGNVTYSWATGDTDTPGLYEAQFVATFSSGKVLSFPNDGWLIVEITNS